MTKYLNISNQGVSNRHPVDPSLPAGGGVIRTEVLCNQVGIRRVPSGWTYLTLAQVLRRSCHEAGWRMWIENKLHHLLNTHIPMWPLKSHDCIIWLLQLLAAAASQIVCCAAHRTDKMEGHCLKTHVFQACFNKPWCIYTKTTQTARMTTLLTNKQWSL